MKKITSIIIVILCVAINTYPQIKFRSGIFLHHSTGENIWGPNGSNTSVPQEMVRYNNQHGYSGNNAVTMNESWFPENNDNEWWIWHQIFETNTPENISPFLQNNRIVMVKSCFPSSAIEGVGGPGDTLTPDYKSIYNYKWHWRHIIRVMRNNPMNFFVIWTNAPLTQEETNQNAAMWSKRFCKWAKDTLAAGLDPVFGLFPRNVYVFDFFSKLTNASGYMLPQYAQDPHDPHPNAAATQLIAPQLVNEVFDHSIPYEQLYGIIKYEGIIPKEYKLYQNYPNPFNPSTRFRIDITKQSDVKIAVYDVQGKLVETLVEQQLKPGNYLIEWDASKYASGIYFFKLIAINVLYSANNVYIETKKMILVK